VDPSGQIMAVPRLAAAQVSFLEAHFRESEAGPLNESASPAAI